MNSRAAASVGIMTSKSPKSASPNWRDVPASVWTLGFVSMLMDISSELIHGLMPVFLVTVLGASTVMIGLIEGISEATAAIAKVFSGTLSDRIGKRKLLVGMGYGLSAIVKPMFPLSNTAWEVLVARFIDRVGKGIREAPRDALVADITPSAIRGASYGIRQALDSAGSVVGPLLAMGLMAFYNNNFRAVFWWALAPAAVCVLLLVVGVREPAGVAATEKRGWPIHASNLKRLPSVFWLVVVIGGVFTLARFSEAFLILKAQAEGLAVGLVPSVFICMYAVYALMATPVGILSDKMGRTGLLLTGLAVLFLADLTLAFMPGLIAAFVGIGLWGMYLGLSQGLLSALVADAAPDDLRGTAFGVFNLIAGGVLLLASVLAGWLWHAFGPTATFLAGAAFSAFAAFILWLSVWARRRVDPLTDRLLTDHSQSIARPCGLGQSNSRDMTAEIKRMVDLA